MTPQRRIEIARRIASTLREEARGIIMSDRAFELADLILLMLTMPDDMLRLNAAKFEEFTA